MTTSKAPTGSMRSGNMRGAVLALLACVTLFISACGITAPRSNDGYADLESLGMRDTNRLISLSIGPTLLHFAARYMDDEPEIRDLLRGLDGVRIRIYEIDGDARRVAQRIFKMSEHLREDGWEPVLLVREQNEEVHMLLRMVNHHISGMTVLVSDGESEAVIINLMGEIRPEQFGDVMVALDVDAPGVDDVQVTQIGEG
ncbi:MAG: DUF4252 domain-containing protein [Proteobacteria bacterium]|nr:DUF4252 domain-containing protein [Pseudomonadota bacterium]